MLITTFSEIAECLELAKAVLPGTRIRIDVAPGGALFLDGVGAASAGSVLLDGVANTVEVGAGGEADSVITISERELGALVDGAIDTKTSFLLGKYRIVGALPNLFRLQEVFTKARSWRAEQARQADYTL